MKFNITANAMFEADNLEDAFLKLSKHFESLAFEVAGESVQKSALIELGKMVVQKSENLSFDKDHYVLGLTDAIYALDRERGLADMVFDDEKSQRIYKVALASAICMILDDIVMVDGENNADSERIITLQTKYMNGTD